MRRIALVTAALGFCLFSCSGAKDQDVLSNDVGGASTNSSSSGTSGTTSGGTTSGGTTSGGTTSGGTTSGGTTSGGTTSGGPGNGCVAEDGDSDTQDNPIKFTTCVSGTLTLPGDQEDFASFEMPKNNGFSVSFNGPITVMFYPPGSNRGYDASNLPIMEGEYGVDIQLDLKKGAGGGNVAKPQDWTIQLSFKN